MRFLCGINTGKMKRGFRQRVQRERMKYYGLGREGENESGGRESGVGFKLRSTFSWSNQHKVFLDIANSHVNTEIILRQCK
jgi:hypothetical protein